MNVNGYKNTETHRNVLYHITSCNSRKVKYTHLIRVLLVFLHFQNIFYQNPEITLLDSAGISETNIFFRPYFEKHQLKGVEKDAMITNNYMVHEIPKSEQKFMLKT